MIFWIVIAGILAGTLYFVWRAWSSQLGISVTPEANELALYSARIEEIQNDLEAGRLDEPMAETAKAEEARKLLRYQQAREEFGENAVQPSGWWMTLGLFSIPLLSVLIYLNLGTPPTSLGQDPEPQAVEQSMEQLVASAERRLENDPDDIRGWEVLVPVYMRQQNFEKAENAFRNIVRIKGESTELLSALGEVMVAKEDGKVTAEALALFQRATELDDAHPTAKFFLGLARMQANDQDGAATIWQSMLDNAQGDEDWVPAIRKRVADLQTGRVRSQTNENAETAEEIASLPEDEQQARVQSMVSGLAAKLEENPADKTGWILLVRAYMVLGQNEEAEDAFQTAAKMFPEDSNFLTRLKEARETPKGAIN